MMSTLQVIQMENNMTPEQVWEQHMKIENKYLNKMHVELGNLYGYLKCCIEQFVREQSLGIQSAIFRMKTHNVSLRGINYVPCDKCVKKIYHSK